MDGGKNYARPRKASRHRRGGEAVKLCDVVQAIVLQEDVSAKDIEATVLFLVQETVLTDVRVLRRIVKQLNADMEYEDAPVS